MCCHQISFIFDILPHPEMFTHNNLILKASHVGVQRCRGVLGVSFFWQCDWLRRMFLAVVLVTLRECVRRSISCAEALVYINLRRFSKAFNCFKNLVILIDMVILAE